MCEYTPETGPLIRQAVLYLHLICCLPDSLGLSALPSWSTPCLLPPRVFVLFSPPAFRVLPPQSAWLLSCLASPPECHLSLTILCDVFSLALPYLALSPFMVHLTASQNFLHLFFVALLFGAVGSPHLCFVSSAPVNLSSVNDFKVWRL